jgi:amidase
MTYAITITSCPALSLPCGFTKNGLPVGIQIIGRTGKDSEVLAAAKLLEDFLGIHERVPLPRLVDKPGEREGGVKVVGVKTKEEAEVHHGLR